MLVELVVILIALLSAYTPVTCQSCAPLQCLPGSLVDCTTSTTSLPGSFELPFPVSNSTMFQCTLLSTTTCDQTLPNGQPTGSIAFEIGQLTAQTANCTDQFGNSYQVQLNVTNTGCMDINGNTYYETIAIQQVVGQTVDCTSPATSFNVTVIGTVDCDNETTIVQDEPCDYCKQQCNGKAVQSCTNVPNVPNGPPSKPTVGKMNNNNNVYNGDCLCSNDYYGDRCQTACPDWSNRSFWHQRNLLPKDNCPYGIRFPKYINQQCWNRFWTRFPHPIVPSHH